MRNVHIEPYEQHLLSSWEEVYKKGQLTMWILLSLLDGKKRMADIKTFIENKTTHSLSADDKSMYRALRRYYDADLIDFSTQPGKGPDIKLYYLTQTGKNVLNTFLKRNVIDVFYKKDNELLIKRGISNE